MYKEITEGQVKIQIPKETKVSRKLPVFYNPAMKLNRDISILLLNATKQTQFNIILPLAGTGVRGVRFLKELKRGKLKTITFNDISPTAIKHVQDNVENNNIKNSKIKTNNKENNENKNKITYENDYADQFLLKASCMNYIDIDPFGSPTPFLDAAVKKILSPGILAITATDTSSLAGTYPNVCRRRYWATPKKGPEMHEIGLRILIRKVQPIGTQYEKALIPIFSYSKDHYMRAFFKVERGKKKCTEIVKQHKMYKEAGPLWMGSLWDTTLVKHMIKENKKAKLIDPLLLETIYDEANIDGVGFHDIHALCKTRSPVPRFTKLITALEKKKYAVSRTHFNQYGLKVNIEEHKLLEIISKL